MCGFKKPTENIVRPLDISGEPAQDWRDLTEKCVDLQRSLAGSFSPNVCATNIATCNLENVTGCILIMLLVEIDAYTLEIKDLEFE